MLAKMVTSYEKHCFRSELTYLQKQKTNTPYLLIKLNFILSVIMYKKHNQNKCSTPLN